MSLDSIRNERALVYNKVHGKVKVVEGPFPFSTETYKEDVWEKVKELKKKYQEKGYAKVKVTYKRVGSLKIDIDNPIENAGARDAFRLESKEKQFYLRFGYLLNYISENILPRIKVGDIHDDNPPIFDIDYNTWDNHMYSLPNQISLDPRVCIVRNSNFNTGRGHSEVFQQLPIFREVDGGVSKNTNAAYPMNVYLNFNFILECLKPDDRGDVNLFEFISAICTGLNKALGGINNLEPIIEEESNTLRIIETTPIPGYSNSSPSKRYTLQLYGYNKSGANYISNFVRNVDLKTAITPEFATMITIGATAGGYVKGTEATAFSKWNVGLLDRYKEEFTPGRLASVKKANEDDEAEVNYATEFIYNGYWTRYGLTSLEGDFNLSSDAIERNLSIVTEYYKYIIAKESVDQDTSGGTVGFIPFKLGITLDGISGIKIYNKLEVNTEFLPKAYGKTVDLIVTGVSHNLSNNDWETQIETTVIPKTGKQSIVSIPENIIQETLQNVAAAKALTGDEKISNVKRIAIYLKSIGFTKEGTMGLLGNILGESGANPKIAEINGAIGGKGGIGIVQWTASRRRKLEAEANNDNNIVKDLNFQLKFLGKELQRSYKSTFNKLSTSTSVEDSTIFVLEKFEVPGTYLNKKKNPKAYEATKSKRISYALSVKSIVDSIYN